MKLQVGASLDGGLTFSDYATIATTAPLASQSSPESSEVYASLDAYKGATHLRFALVNLDGTNNAAVMLQYRASA